MALINEHVDHLRSGTSADSGHKPLSNSLKAAALPDETDDDDDFLAKYKASMNSDIARQASQLKTSEQKKPVSEVTFLLVLRGKKMKMDDVPSDWIKPLGLRVSQTTSFAKMRENFLKSKRYKSEVVLAWKGVRLRHGTATDVGMGDKDEIGIAYK
jgi:hypothetical protein